MKATICRKAHFNSAHRLHVTGWSDERNAMVFGKCNNPNFHGHNYCLEVKVTGEIDPETGYVIDTKLLGELMEMEVIAAFDHKNLNLDTEEFKQLNPTAENIALVIYNKLGSKLGLGKKLTIVLHETERNYVEFSGN